MSKELAIDAAAEVCMESIQKGGENAHLAMLPILLGAFFGIEEQLKRGLALTIMEDKDALVHTMITLAGDFLRFKKILSHAGMDPGQFISRLADTIGEADPLIGESLKEVFKHVER